MTTAVVCCLPAIGEDCSSKRTSGESLSLHSRYSAPNPATYLPGMRDAGPDRISITPPPPHAHRTSAVRARTAIRLEEWAVAMAALRVSTNVA